MLLTDRAIFFKSITVKFGTRGGGGFLVDDLPYYIKDGKNELQTM